MPNFMDLRLSRRQMLSGLLASTLGLDAAPVLAASKVCQDVGPVLPYSQAINVSIGDVNRSVAWGIHIEGEVTYDQHLADVLAREKPRVLAIGSSMKFGNLHPLSIACEREDNGRKISTWVEVDDIVALAGRCGAQLRGDALIWNDWLPDWLTQLPKQRPAGWRDLLQRAMEQHFIDVMDHFEQLEQKAGKVLMPWCAPVNEPFEAWAVEAGKNPWRQGAWLNAFDPEPDGTPGYIGKAFDFAKKHGRTPRDLFLNEAFCDNDRFGRKMRPALLKLVSSLKNSGRKVDAVGLESHLMPQWMDNPATPDWSGFRKFIDDLAALGVKVYITELDVNDCSITDIGQRDDLVALYMQSFVEACVQSSAVTMVTNWDFSDNTSWLRDDSAPGAVYPNLGKWASCNAHPACPRPTIYDQNLMPKLARDALVRGLALK